METTIIIEMCNNNACPKKHHCYRYLGYIANPEKYPLNTIRFYNICGEKNNYKWQWFGGVEELRKKMKEWIEKEENEKNEINEKNEKNDIIVET